jgi:hypothetical protein
MKCEGIRAVLVRADGAPDETKFNEQPKANARGHESSYGGDNVKRFVGHPEVHSRSAVGARIVPPRQRVAHSHHLKAVKVAYSRKRVPTGAAFPLRAQAALSQQPPPEQNVCVNCARRVIVLWPTCTRPLSQAPTKQTFLCRF